MRAGLGAVGFIDSAAINALTGADGDIRRVLDVTGDLPNLAGDRTAHG